LTFKPLTRGFKPKCPLDKTSMTIISTAPQEKEAAEFKSFPPVTDTIVWIKQVDWEDVRQRCKGGLNNVGLVLAVVGEKTYDFGHWLSEL
tara:strand:+ start:172 stop:441 length:270 start_codon:yes stop_codon:yes gene_type:complete